QSAVDVSAESFAVVGRGDGVPVVERMEMRGVAGDGDTVLFGGAAAEIDAYGVETPLVVDDADFEHAARLRVCILQVEEALRGRAFRRRAEDDFEGVGGKAGEWSGGEEERVAGGVSALGVGAGVAVAFEVDGFADGRVDDLRRANGGDLRAADFCEVVEAPGHGLLGLSNNGEAGDGEREDGGGEEFHVHTSI